MVELNKNRVLFKKGKQSLFIEKAMHNLGYSHEDLSNTVGCHARTVREWKKEKYSMPISAVKHICTISRIPFPKEVTLRSQYWYVEKAAQLGGKATSKKYGGVPVSEEYRKSQWKKWWNEKGENILIMRTKKPVAIPQISEELAEFAGIMAGDGGISKYQIHVTLNKVDDREYSFFVKKLIYKIFSVQPSRIERKCSKGVDILVSRTDIVTYCVNYLHLPIGDKIRQGLDAPPWVVREEKYMVPFIRGLVDTDGCVVIETHHIKGKTYSYPRLNFTTYSLPLLHSTFNMLTRLGFHPKIRTKGKSIQLENIKEICKYFKVIGSHNPKHIRRIRRFMPHLTKSRIGVGVV